MARPRAFHAYGKLFPTAHPDSLTRVHLLDSLHGNSSAGMAKLGDIMLKAVGALLLATQVPAAIAAQPGQDRGRSLP